MWTGIFKVSGERLLIKTSASLYIFNSTYKVYYVRSFVVSSSVHLHDVIKAYYIQTTPFSQNLCNAHHRNGVTSKTGTTPHAINDKIPAPQSFHYSEAPLNLAIVLLAYVVEYIKVYAVK